MPDQFDDKFAEDFEAEFGAVFTAYFVEDFATPDQDFATPDLLRVIDYDAKIKQDNLFFEIESKIFSGNNFETVKNLLIQIDEIDKKRNSLTDVNPEPKKIKHR